jgi:hypothetical protein
VILGDLQSAGLSNLQKQSKHPLVYTIIQFISHNQKNGAILCQNQTQAKIPSWSHLLVLNLSLDTTDVGLSGVMLSLVRVLGSLVSGYRSHSRSDSTGNTVDGSSYVVLNLTSSLLSLTLLVLLTSLRFKVGGTDDISDKLLARSDKLVLLALETVLVVDSDSAGGKVERTGRCTGTRCVALGIGIGVLLVGGALVGGVA